MKNAPKARKQWMAKNGVCCPVQWHPDDIPGLFVPDDMALVDRVERAIAKAAWDSVKHKCEPIYCYKHPTKGIYTDLARSALRAIHPRLGGKTK